MKTLATILTSMLLAAAGIAAELGDAAKPLDIKDWVKGSPVDLAAGKGKSIYVIEFWATWCAPCLTSIPHLTEMQKKFKDKGVVFVGVSNEKTDVVKKFVDKMGDKMNYTVAVDAGKTSTGYMEAYGIQGIPHAFIVDKEGRIAWHGHPMDKLEETLEQVVAGTHDLSASKKRAEVETKLREYVELTVSGQDPAKAKQLEAELVALEKEFGNIMSGEKFDPEDVKKRIAFGQKFMRYQQLMVAEADPAEIAALEKELIAEAPKDLNFNEVKAGLQQAVAQRKEMMQVQKLFGSYAEAVSEGGNAEKAAELGKQLSALTITNSEVLNGIAFTILTDERIKNRDTQLALGLAKRAFDATGGKDPSVLDTYARALFETGDVAGAVVQQKKAIELEEDDEAKAELKATLAKYEAKAPAAK